MLGAKICQRILSRHTLLNIVRNDSTYYDPPYLESLKPKIPLCKVLNVQIKGYDFALVESFQKLVNKFANAMDLEVTDSWALPAKMEQIQKYKPNSKLIETEYILPTYERNVQITDMQVNVAPIFIEIIQAALPQGVSFEVHEHLEEHEKVRYVPDYELKELKTQLQTLGGPTKKKKRF